MWYISFNIQSVLEKAMAPHSSTLAWKIPWTEEPGRLQSMGSIRVRQDWTTSLWLFTFMHWRRKWHPTPVFLAGESQERGSLVGCSLWGHRRVRHNWSDLAAAAAQSGQTTQERENIKKQVFFWWPTHLKGLGLSIMFVCLLFFLMTKFLNSKMRFVSIQSLQLLIKYCGIAILNLFLMFIKLVMKISFYLLQYFSLLKFYLFFGRDVWHVGSSFPTTVEPASPLSEA